MLAEAPNPGEQLDEWIAYRRINPFGPARGDMQAGIVANAIRQANGLDPKIVNDYIIDFGDEEEEKPMPTAEELEAKLMLWAQAHNARCIAGE